jgi:hypothetical protein
MLIRTATSPSAAGGPSRKRASISGVPDRIAKETPRNREPPKAEKAFIFLTVPQRDARAEEDSPSRPDTFVPSAKLHPAVPRGRIDSGGWGQFIERCDEVRFFRSSIRSRVA